jgi:acyl carrier protein
VVLAREDTPGNKQLVAYAIARASQAPDAEALQAFLGARLPDYMTPAKFVFLDAFPLTQNGKVDRKALPAPASLLEAGTGGEGAAPRSEKERKLAAMWRELLEIDSLGIDQDVFDLGAHSLMVVKAVSRIRDEFRVDVQLRNLFEFATVSGQAEVIEKLAWGAQSEMAEEGERGGEREEIEI